MRKRFIVLMLLPLALGGIFLTNTVEAIPITEQYAANKVADIQQLDNMFTELEEDLKVERGITYNRAMENVELEDAIDEVLNLEETKNKVEIIGDIYRKVADIVERQYTLKKQFVVNTKDIYTLTTEFQDNLREVKLELKDIAKDDNKTIAKETYYEIIDITEELKKEIKENEYVIGEIAKETRNYIRLVRNKNFRKAVTQFEEILELQNEQIELLQIINDYVNELNVILANV